jgi:hypothetical protein
MTDSSSMSKFSSSALPLLPPSPLLPLLPPPPPMERKHGSLRRHADISSSQVLVEMLDSALKEVATAEEELKAKEAASDALWVGTVPSWSGYGDDIQTEEYHEARLAVHDAEQRVAWCEKKVEITMEMAVNPPLEFSKDGNVLVTASCIGNVQVVFALLSQRMNVNATAHGMTALAYAAQGPLPDSETSAQNYLIIVKALLQAGADVHIADHNGKSILSRAIDCGQKEIELVLRAAGAV